MAKILADNAARFAEPTGLAATTALVQILIMTSLIGLPVALPAAITNAFAIEWAGRRFKSVWPYAVASGAIHGAVYPPLVSIILAFSRGNDPFEDFRNIDTRPSGLHVWVAFTLTGAVMGLIYYFIAKRNWRVRPPSLPRR